jgi:hypothetical protein
LTILLLPLTLATSAVLFAFLPGASWRSPENLVFGLYVPMPLLLALNFFFLIRALIRIDSENVALASSRGLPTDGIPRPGGSSLSFLLPFALPLGLLPLTGLDEGVGKAAVTLLVAVAIGVPYLFAGLGLEDLRLLLWRQTHVGRRFGNGQSLRARVPWTGVLLALMLLCPASFVLCYNRSELLYHWIHSLAVSVTMVAASVPLFLVGRQLDDLVSAWRAAVVANSDGPQDPGNGSLNRVNALRWLTRMIMVLPVGVLCAMTATFVFFWPTYLNDQVNTALWLGTIWIAVLTQRRVLQQVTFWCQAHLRVCQACYPNARLQDNLPSAPALVMTAATAGLSIFTALVLGGIIALKLRISWNESIAMNAPLVIVLVHTPSVWLAFLTNQVLAFDKRLRTLDGQQFECSDGRPLNRSS